MSALKELSGKTFGRLTVIGRAETRITSSGQRKSFWHCTCSCGTLVDVMSQSLIRGFTKSCGCLNAEMRVTTNTKHGHGGAKATQVYRAWCSIRGRCYNEKCERFPRYGGRGIKVCDRWLESFENFLSDMGEPPTPRHSIDRFPNNDGNYEPGNCRWAVSKEQSRNRSSNRMLTISNETLTMIEWSERSGVPYKSIFYRLGVGWDAERAVFTPVKKK